MDRIFLNVILKYVVEVAYKLPEKEMEVIELDPVLFDKFEIERLAGPGCVMLR